MNHKLLKLTQRAPDSPTPPQVLIPTENILFTEHFIIGDEMVNRIFMRDSRAGTQVDVVESIDTIQALWEASHKATDHSCVQKKSDVRPSHWD